MFQLSVLLNCTDIKKVILLTALCLKGCLALCQTDIILNYSGFDVLYDSEHLIPKWVAYELTSEESDGTISRSGSFGMDMNYKGRQAMREDYSRSGWDKGHMAPAADMKWSQQAMWESFYLTNICPQNHDLNSGDWLALEKKARELAKKYSKVNIVCGPIIGDNKYGTIGSNKVTVPDKFFKAFLIAADGEYHSIAFVMENEGTHRKLSSYVLTVNQLEAITGIDLFAELPDSIEESVEEESDLEVFLSEGGGQDNAFDVENNIDIR